MAITLERVNEVVVALVADRTRRNPHWEGQDENSCVYTNEKGEHCIVGQVLFECGIPLPLPMDSANDSILNENIKAFDGLEQYQAFEADAARFLADLQIYADDGGTWAEAYERLTAEGHR